tara:strand:+ start:559 stop:723 length:165 start_codon:yes stop_codon:yes gene_type:complete
MSGFLKKKNSKSLLKKERKEKAKKVGGPLGNFNFVGGLVISKSDLDMLHIYLKK